MNTRPVRRCIALAATATFALAATGCGDDAAPSAESSVAVTTAAAATTTETAPATTAAPTTSDTSPVTTEAPTTTAAPTTTEVPAPTWAPTGEMPALAYLPCCASNYVGDPSPAIPSDASAALEPGIYKAFRQQPAEGEVFDPSTIEFSLSPFVPCGTADVFCEEPFAPGEVGVGDVARQVAMPLTDEVRVVVSGFACTPDGNFAGDVQAGTGTLLATLQAEFEAAFAETVAPLVDDTPFEDYATIFATPVDGFSVPCASAGVLQWQGSAGPTLLLQSVVVYDDALGESIVPASMSIPILHLTAYEVGSDGSETLYFYAGFLS